MAYSTFWGSRVPPWQGKNLQNRKAQQKRQLGSSAASVSGPPDDFSFREIVAARTAVIVQRRWPELMDVVQEGSLVLVERAGGSSESEPEIVILVGTAHVSRVSALQVEKVINAVRPDNVVVELCRSRSGMMYLDPSSEGAKSLNLFSLTGTDRNAALARSFKLGGQSAFLLRILLAKVSEKLAKFAAVSAGAEFRAARKAAKEVGAQLVLGDRPIEITLNRAWRALSWNERLSLATALWQTIAFAKVDLSEKSLKLMKSDDALSTMYAEVGRRFPSLLRYLIWERDLYLAWSLKRSKAVTGCKVVVGVVGKGHLRGVVYALLNSQEHLTFQVVGQNQVEASKLDPLRSFQFLIFEGLLGLLPWLIYNYISSSRAM